MQDKQVLKILCHGVSKTQFDYTCCIEGPEGGRFSGHKGQALVFNNIPLTKLPPESTYYTWTS